MKVSLSAIAVCAVLALSATGCGSSLSPAGAAGDAADPVYEFSLSPDGNRMVTRSRNRGITIRDVESRKVVTHLRFENAEPCSVAFHPKDDVILASYLDGRVVRWKRKGSDYQPLEIGRHKKSVRAMDFSSDGKFAATGDYSDEVFLWQLEGKPRIVHRFRIKGSASALRFTPDDSILAIADEESDVVFHNVHDGTKARPAFPAPNITRAIAFSPDGKLMAVGNMAGELTLVDLQTNRTVWKQAVNRFGIRHVLFDRDGRRLVVSDLLHGNVEFREVASGRLQQRINAHRTSISCIAFLPSGQLMTSGHDGELRLLPANDPERLALLSN